MYTEPVFSGVIPKARITAGTSACVVAAWLYNSVLAKKKATANKNGYAVTMLDAMALISGICPFTKVSPNHATPSTQTQADKPDLNVLVLTSCAVSSLQKNVIAAAIIIIKPTMASFRPKITGLIIPIFLEIAVA